MTVDVSSTEKAGAENSPAVPEGVNGEVPRSMTESGEDIAQMIFGSPPGGKRILHNESVSRRTKDLSANRTSPLYRNPALAGASDTIVPCPA